ncbi:MAG TPA: type I DNA topoisomerase [Gemmatimonadota bacterium]|nr:type I DNA topoisomerase [Gemmatimonadota bacterium]
MSAKPTSAPGREGSRRRSGAPNLVIVESPAKARTIERYLGSGFVVEASIGHVRDLPRGAKEVPARFKGEPWARLGVNVDEGFEPIYVTVPGKSEQITRLKRLLEGAETLWLATDEDREGEAISWHLTELLKPRVPVRRLVFHEITREAIERALERPRGIDEGLVRAQEARRILDRLYGYEVSPLLWRKIGPKLSAGRVQSVAVRLVVERERERRRFRSAGWHDLLGRFRPGDEVSADPVRAAAEAFEAALVAADGKRVPTGRDFDPATGAPKSEDLLLLDEAGAAALAERLDGAAFRVTAVKEKPYASRPAAPFTTSTLQQEANRKLGFSARRTMRIAQSLYENGHITYMRTDSTNLAQVAIEAARDLVGAEYGEAYLPAQPRVYQSKVKNAQEAHEAIRPAGHPFELPEALEGQLSAEEFRLFELIWKRTVASQMSDARGRRMTITIEGGGATFEVRGKTIDFPGYLRAYVEGSDDPDAELADQETLLPPVREGQPLECLALEVKGHTTQPPARYTEASLVQALEQLGIGRPSTYASILETIQEREYVFKRGNALVPTWVAISVVRLLERHLPGLVDYEFTAGMEDELDAISRGELGHVEYLRRFYFGNGDTGLKELLESKVDEVDARDVCTIAIGTPEGEDEPVVVRVGRYGPYLQQGEGRRASLPEDLPPDELTLELASELLRQGELAEEPLGAHPETGQPVYLKTGRYGPYVQLGEGDGDGKPKRASLLRGMDPASIDLATAVRLLSLPRELGRDPGTGEPVEAHVGRYGQYVKRGKDTRSLPPDLSSLDVTLEQALALLAQPKRRAGTGRAEPIRTFDPSPVTGAPIELREGRYGPYVSDGQTNASIPKGVGLDDVTFDMAVSLLAERAARGPAKGGRRSRGKAAGKAPRKKATGKKASRKKASTRKASGKAGSRRKASKKQAAEPGEGPPETS